MPDHVVRKVIAGLNLDGKPVRGSTVLILGVAFKRDIDDARNSPAQRVIELLLDAGAHIEYHDPFVATFRTGGNALHRRPTTLRSISLDEGLNAADAVVILTGHTTVDYAQVVSRVRVVVDAVNVTGEVAEAAGRVIRLGAPMPVSL